MLRVRFYYELRVMGRYVLLVPPLIILAWSLIAILLHFLHVDPDRFLSSSLDMILPLSAGIIVTTVASQDPALELQLTLPRLYRTTALIRLALIVAWVLCIAFLFSLFINVLHLTFWPAQLAGWSPVMRFLALQLTWLAPLCWFVSVGLCLGLLLRNAAAAAGLLSAIWLAETVFKDILISTAWLRPIFLFPTTLTPAIDFWFVNRVEILLTGVVLLLVGWFLLHNTEGLLKGASEA